MKKILIFSIPILAIIMIMSTTLVKSDYVVTIGSEFTYDVVESSQTVTIGGDTGGGDGFRFNEQSFTLTEQIFVEVTDATSSVVYYKVTVGNNTKSTQSGGIEDAGNLYNDLRGSLFYINSFSVWTQSEVDAGPLLFCDYFIDPNYSNAFLRYTNETYLELTFPDTAEITYTKLAGNFDNSSTIAVFDWAFDFEMKNTTDNTDFVGKHRWKYAFDKTTGVVQGWKVAIECSGTILGVAQEFTMNQCVEIEGYNIDGFHYRMDGFESLLAIPALVVVVGIMTVKRKRK
ncbi:MAG: choice-of-anchor S family protein [Candidatus Heimdallarchaeota archaeon]